MKTIQFGSEELTTILDDEGSTETRGNVYRNGVPNRPIRIRRKIRHASDVIDLNTIGSIAQDLLSDPSKLDAVIELERGSPKGGSKYYIVECYTVLEY